MTGARVFACDAGRLFALTLTSTPCTGQALALPDQETSAYFMDEARYGALNNLTQRSSPAPLGSRLRRPLHNSG